MTKLENVKNTIIDSLRDVQDMLEYERESINIEESEKHRDFCLDLLERLED